MPASMVDDWSDSDEDTSAGMETDVLLGVPDGRVETDADLKDAAVSRIGGLPAFLPSREPPFSASQCKVCSNPMELLLQVWCPFEKSPMDRALYVWGCARSTCQRRAGSIRAWRGLRYNAVYATKLNKKTSRPTAQYNTPSSPPLDPTTLVNPFSTNTAVEPVTFGLGDQIFGNPGVGISNQLEQDRDDSSDDSSSEDSLITAISSARLADSFWAAAPSYPAVYLSTLSEYVPQPSRAKVPASARMEDPIETDSKTGRDATWALETYENSLRTDNVFDRFTKRVECTGEQCIRYELKGVPLPFASDKIFDLLFPTAIQTLFPVTRASFKATQPMQRSYSTASIPSCPCCRSGRVFECQLMPNLINVLRDSDDVQLTDEQRMKAVQDALGHNNEPGRRGMEWGTCMVFSCGGDCCLNDEGLEDKECWREEYVLVQWEE